MNKEDMILISVDDHIVEPPDMFENHLPAKYLDQAPRVVRNPDGSERGSSASGDPQRRRSTPSPAGPRRSTASSRTAFDEMRPGCYDVDERVKDMDAGGVLGSMSFPSFPGFAGRLFAHRGQGPRPRAAAGLQRLARRRVVRRLPGRFIPMALPVIWDPEPCADEVRRGAEKGCTR